MFNFKIPEGCKQHPSKIPNDAAYKKSKLYVEKFDYALDIGGHVGTMARRIASDFKNVTSFEPLWGDYLEENTKDLNNVDIRRHGLGQFEKNENIFVLPRNTGGSSIVKHPNRTWQNEAKTKPIHLKPLDDLQLTDIDFIKIDVESYEYYVLAGARETLKNSNPILMIEFLDMYENPKIKHSETISLLSALGYSQIDQHKQDKIFRKI